LIVPLAVGLVDELRGTKRRGAAFNAATCALTAAVAGGVYELAGGTVGQISLPGQLPQLLLLAATAYAVNLLLVEGIVSALSGRRLRELASETARGQVLSATSEAGFGLVLAYFLIRSPWGILALAPLVIAVYKAHARLELQREETARALETFATVVDERDAFTSDHSLRVAETVQSFAGWLGLSAADAARLRWAGRLHDLGKITVDTTVLHKPTRLDEREWAAVRAHPRLSARLLRRFSLAGDEARAVELHHERFDGTGYYGVPNERIPLAAHMLIVADTFDAITNDRPYREGYSLDEALDEIARASGTQFHPEVAKAFIGFKRGATLAETLDPAERSELAELWGTGTDSARRRSYRPSGRAAALVLVLCALGAWGVGSPLAALALVAAALAATIFVVAAHERMWRLAVSIGNALAAGELAGVVSAIDRADPVRFAGLSTGASPVTVPLAGVDTLDQAAVRAWLAADPDRDSVRTLDAAGLGEPGFVLAVPTGREASLVLHLDAPPSEPLRRALERCLPDFRAAAIEAVESKPARRRLTAIA
jgi:HD-GYP domain-containing protein (c-di-GMP phosphodiesterase class II)